MHTRAFFFPAAGIGLLLAVAFFKIYGPLTRPPVPAPVSQAMTLYIRGVSIGKSVREVKGVPPPYWVRNLGYVADLNQPRLVQVRYLMSPEHRAQPYGDQRWPIDAVELVGDPEVFLERTEMSSAVARMGGRQHEGCMLPERAGFPRRDVSYWTTKNDRGGMAVLSDHLVMDAASERVQREADAARRAYALEQQRMNAEQPPSAVPTPKRVALSSAVFWSGPFDGARTLRGNFVSQRCDEVSDPPRAPVELAPTIAAAESLLVQLGYRPDLD